MKIRLGFISNSSSSSFIVYPENVDSYQNLTNSDIKLLLSEGFKMSDDVYGLGVVINGDDVVHMLVKNNIPFTAILDDDTRCVRYFKNSNLLFDQSKSNFLLGTISEVDILNKMEKDPDAGIRANEIGNVINEHRK